MSFESNSELNDPKHASQRISEEISLVGTFVVITFLYRVNTLSIWRISSSTIGIFSWSRFSWFLCLLHVETSSSPNTHLSIRLPHPMARLWLKRQHLNLHFVKLCNYISLIFILLQFSTTIFPMYESVKNVIMSCNTAVIAPLKGVLCNYFLPRKHRHKRKEWRLGYVIIHLCCWCSDDASKPETS